MFREITVIDDTCLHPLSFTLWDDYATKEGSIISNQHQKSTVVIAAAKVRVRFYLGLGLSTGINTIVEINPNRPEVQQLQLWANQNASRVKNRITAVEINDASKETVVEGAVMKGWIVRKANREPWYIACNTCNKKVFEYEGICSCENCHHSSPIATYR